MSDVRVRDRKGQYRYIEDMCEFVCRLCVRHAWPATMIRGGRRGARRRGYRAARDARRRRSSIPRVVERRTHEGMYWLNLTANHNDHRKNKKLNPESRFVVSSQNPIFFVISSIQNLIFDFVPSGGVHQKFQNKIYQRRIKNALLQLLLLCDRARFCQNILTLGRCKTKMKTKK